MEKKMVTVMCIKERKAVFGGKEGEFYLLDENSIVEIVGQKYGEIYTMENNFLGFWGLNRFICME